MRIVIAGAGSVGAYMAAELGRIGHGIVLVDNDSSVSERARSIDRATFLLGDACDVDVLAGAGAGGADVVAAVTGDDEDNLVIALLAKQEFGVPRVVARVNNPKNEWMFNEMWGVDVSVSTPHLLTALVEEAVTEGSFVRLLSFEHGRAALCGVTLAADSPAIGREVAGAGLPREATVVGIIRDAHVVTPTPDTVLRVHDEVLILARSEAEEAIRASLTRG